MGAAHGCCSWVKRVLGSQGMHMGALKGAGRRGAYRLPGQGCAASHCLQGGRRRCLLHPPASTRTPNPRPCTHSLQQFNPTALSKGKLQDNNEFMQWFYGYWESVVSGQEIEYDAVGRRQAAKSGDWKKVGCCAGAGGCTSGGWPAAVRKAAEGGWLKACVRPARAPLPSALLQFSLGGAATRQASSTIPAVRCAGAGARGSKGSSAATGCGARHCACTLSGKFERR